MMDYEGLWHGFVILFGVLPVTIGACLGVLWGWRNGRRGLKLVPAATFGAGATGLAVFASAVLLFRA